MFDSLSLPSLLHPLEVYLRSKGITGRGYEAQHRIHTEILTILETTTWYSCEFTRGDGVGDSEVKIGGQTGEDCVRACVARKKTDPSINGVTVMANSSPGCYCERQMRRNDDSPTYKTCFLLSKREY